MPCFSSGNSGSFLSSMSLMSVNGSTGSSLSFKMSSVIAIGSSAFSGPALISGSDSAKMSFGWSLAKTSSSIGSIATGFVSFAGKVTGELSSGSVTLSALIKSSTGTISSVLVDFCKTSSSSNLGVIGSLIMSFLPFFFLSLIWALFSSTNWLRSRSNSLYSILRLSKRSV